MVRELIFNLRDITFPKNLPNFSVKHRIAMANLPSDHPLHASKVNERE